MMKNQTDLNDVSCNEVNIDRRLNVIHASHEYHNSNFNISDQHNESFSETEKQC